MDAFWGVFRNCGDFTLNFKNFIKIAEILKYILKNPQNLWTPPKSTSPFIELFFKFIYFSHNTTIFDLCYI